MSTLATLINPKIKPTLATLGRDFVSSHIAMSLFVMVLYNCASTISQNDFYLADAIVSTFTVNAKQEYLIK